MRASIGFRVGPVYLGTGNLLKTRRRRRRGPDALEILFVYPFIGLWLLLKYTMLLYWWIGLYTWRGGSWAVREIASARAARRLQSSSVEDSRPHAW